MFTSCPACQRQYRITAEQLAAARGIARCGYCGEEFSALARLTDKPVNLSIKIPEADQAPAVANDEYEPQFDIPEILENEEKPPRSLAARIFWFVSVVFLLLVIIFQLAWFNRDELIQRYPQIKPWAERLCERLDCQVTRVSGARGIRLLNRDVRLHPNFQDTLLVNATMANRSERVVRFPEIQFALFDTDGNMIAERKFNPVEYLDNSIDIEQGMLIDHPVHFVLEVTGPIHSAVSFEFRFL